MERYEIALTAEVAETGGKVVEMRGIELGVFRVGDAYRAYRNLCPHAGAPICAGRIVGTTLRCPWHGWEFDLTTGAHIANPTCMLTAYAVEVEGDKLFVWA